MEAVQTSEDLTWYTRLFRDPAFQQFGLLIVFIVIGSVLGSVLGASLTNSLGSAMSVVILITLIVLPISYVMNYLFYHSRAMRAGGGVVGWLMGPLIWIFILFQSVRSVLTDSGKVPYFGMFPLFDSAAPVEMREGTWLKPLYFAWDQLTQLFRFNIGRDVDLARPLLAAYWEPEIKRSVPESIYAQARDLATRAATDMAPFESLVGEPREAKEAELAADRAAQRSALGAELNRLLNGT